MPLQNFGSILNFAEELESQDLQFYEAAAGNPACGPYKSLFAELGAEAGRSVQTVRRIRRENVTEMILEPITDFIRTAFCEPCEGAAVNAAADVLATARRLESRAERYYIEAAEKIKALTEVSRALKTLGKIRRNRLSKLSNLDR